MSKRFVAGLVAAVGFLAGGATASAEPEGLPVHAVCDGEHHDLEVRGHGHWAPAHELETGLVYRAQAFRFPDGTFISKPNVDLSELLECTFETPFDSGTVWVIVSGPPGDAS